jgi:hypothetical protein
VVKEEKEMWKRKRIIKRRSRKECVETLVEGKEK